MKISFFFKLCLFGIDIVIKGLGNVYFYREYKQIIEASLEFLVTRNFNLMAFPPAKNIHMRIVLHIQGDDEDKQLQQYGLACHILTDHHIYECFHDRSTNKGLVPHIK